MRLTGLTLPILLGALLLQVVTEEMTQHFCPQSLKTCPWKPEMHCHSDEDCNGTQKCCLNGCDVLCTDPEVIKKGVCPRSTTLLSSCRTTIFMMNRYCSGDQDCTGKQKCCLHDCQYSCQNPAVIKPGDCPKSLTPCSEDLKMNCLDDDNCNGTQKCCLDGCVYSCTDPEVIKPGVCPIPPTPDTACPSVIPMEDRKCTGDQNCNGTQKCCKDGCGYSCKDPVGIKEGVCPECLNPCSGNIKKNCDSDQKCNGRQKCCQDGCQYSCTDPAVMMQRVCPQSTKPKDSCFLTIPSVLCRSDACCKGGKMCCYYNCDLVCMDPVEIKKGKCPELPRPVTASRTVIPMKDRNCTGDRSCHGTQKCCKDGSGYSCKNPVD